MAPGAGSQRRRRASTPRRSAAKDTTATPDRRGRMVAAPVPRAATVLLARPNPFWFPSVPTPAKRGQSLQRYARQGSMLPSRDRRSASGAVRDTPAKGTERTSPGSAPRARTDRGWIPSPASCVLREPTLPMRAPRISASVYPAQIRGSAASRVCSTSVYPRHATVGTTAALVRTGFDSAITSVPQVTSVVTTPTRTINMCCLAARVTTVREERHWQSVKRTNASSLITALRALRHRSLWRRTARDRPSRTVPVPRVCTTVGFRRWIFAISRESIHPTCLWICRIILTIPISRIFMRSRSGPIPQ